MATEETAKRNGEKIREDLFTHFVEDDIKAIKFKPNTIHTIPMHKIAVYSSLTYLCLRKCNLIRLNEEIFSSFRRLNWLDVRDNKLTEFPNEVNHQYLETILLGGNKIEKLPIELGSFPNLVCLQVTGNPLLYPDSDSLIRYGLDLVSFLKLCWKNKSEKPTVKQKSSSKTKGKSKQGIKKDENLLKVKQFGNIASVLVEKMNSLDPIDQLLASRVLKKMRDVDSRLQRIRDEEVLKAWREMYQPKAMTGQPTARAPPFDVDPDYMTMMSRRDLKNSLEQDRKKSNPGPSRKQVSLSDELQKLDEQLDSMRSWRPTSDPSADKMAVLNEIRNMQDIFKKIKQFKSSHLI